MRKARIFVNQTPAGFFIEHKQGDSYEILYGQDYTGLPISLTMPVKNESYTFQKFPPFFDGLLPEGQQLEALLRKHKIDPNDYFEQLMRVGGDMVGAVSVIEVVNE